jgi:hypothetical protein
MEINNTYNTIRKHAFVNAAGSGLRDLWDYTTVLPAYIYIPYNGDQPQGEDIYMSSSHNSDNQNIKIIGLDANGEWQEQKKQLQGFSRVQLDSQAFRIFRAFNNDTTLLQGNVYIYRLTTAGAGGIPTDTSQVQAQIILGKEQTQMSQFTIPFNMRGWIKNFMITVIKNAIDQDATFSLWLRKPGKTFRLQTTSTLNTSGTGSFERNYDENEDPDNHDFPLGAGDDMVWRYTSSVTTTGLACETIYKLAKL